MSMYNAPGRDSFVLQDWRDGVEARRKLMRHVIYKICVLKEAAGPTYREFQRAINYHRLADKDKRAFSVAMVDIRRIVDNWDMVTESERQKLFNDDLVISTLSKNIKNRIL